MDLGMWVWWSEGGTKGKVILGTMKVWYDWHSPQLIPSQLSQELELEKQDPSVVYHGLPQQTSNAMMSVTCLHVIWVVRGTWKDEENNTISPKKSSGFGASGELGSSPKYASKERKSDSKLLLIFFSASTRGLASITKGCQSSTQLGSLHVESQWNKLTSITWTNSSPRNTPACCSFLISVRTWSNPNTSTLTVWETVCKDTVVTSDG